MKQRKISLWLGLPLIFTLVGGLLWLERRRPLRPQAREPGLRRQARNLTLAAIGAVVLQIIQQPLVMALSRRAVRQHRGLLQIRPLPAWLEVSLALLLMDYTLYLWHVLLHRLPLLWRFHAVHHSDPDMDTSTSLRFHVGELLFSVLWRLAQIRLIGVSPLALWIWEGLMHASILFHHANLRLPERFEAGLGQILVTPGLHAIHHSVVPSERESNYSSGLTLWDRLHGSLKRDVAQDAIQIGLPEYPDPAALSLGRLLTLPFAKAAKAATTPANSRENV